MDERLLLLNSGLPRWGDLGSSLYLDTFANSGNAYIGHALTRLFGMSRGRDVINSNLTSNDYDLEALAERSQGCTHILLCLQDQLQAGWPDLWFHRALQALERLASEPLPLTVLSLCANAPGDYSTSLADSLSPVQRRFFAYLADRANCIGVRGRYSAEVLGELGIKNVRVAGCPTYFETGRGRRVRTVAEAGLDGGVGLTGDLRLTHVEDRAHYFLQGESDWPLIELLYGQGGRNPDWSEQQAYWLRHPLYDATLRAAVEGRTRFFTDPVKWKTYVSRHCAIVAGSRLHATILALNAGVPALCTNSDARAREACEFLGIPHAPDGVHHDATLADIAALIDVQAVNDRYDPAYEDFSAFCSHAGLPLKAEIGDGVSVESPRLLPPSLVASRVVNLLMRHRGDLYDQFTGELARAQEALVTHESSGAQAR